METISLPLSVKVMAFCIKCLPHAYDIHWRSVDVMQVLLKSKFY